MIDSCVGGDIEHVEYCINQGISVNCCYAKKTPLFGASLQGQYEIAKLLISEGADVNYRNLSYEATALHIAAYENFYELSELLIKNKAEVDAVDTSNTTAIALAAEVGNSSIVRLLLNYKANVNICANGKSPLFRACFHGFEETARILWLGDLENKINSICGGFSNAHEFALDLLEEEITTNKNKDIINMKVDGKSLLHSAVLGGNKKIIKKLLALGANINIKDDDGT